MADTVTIKRWTDIQSASTGHFTVKDDDFGEPGVQKYCYGCYITYKSNANKSKKQAVNYVINGGTTFGTALITAGTLTSQSAWNVGAIKFSSPLLCQSIRWKFLTDAQTFDVNDISNEFRPIYRRVS